MHFKSLKPAILAGHDIPLVTDTITPRTGHRGDEKADKLARRGSMMAFKGPKSIRGIAK